MVQDPHAMDGLSLVVLLAAAAFPEAPGVPAGGKPPAATADAIRFGLLEYTDRVEGRGPRPEPREGSTVQRGARVTVVVKRRYQVSVEKASVWLVVLKRPADLSRGAGFWPLAETKRRSLSGSEGELTLTTRFAAPDEARRLDVFVAATAPGVRTSGRCLEVR